jgi:RsiW-degrading membrane proteinase PrsW (M82 family)
MHLLLLLAVAPGAFIVYRVYKEDKIEKEPASLIRKLLLAGFVSVIPALILEIIGSMILDGLFGGVRSYLYIALDAFLGTALIEELVKYFPLKKLTWKNPEFNFTFDGIVYAVSVGMGFAIIENIAYVFSNGLGNALMRAVTAIPGHAVFAVYMGYYYGCAKKSEAEGDDAGVKRLLKKALWVPVFIHGFYDFCLMSDSLLLILLFFVFIIILFIKTYKNLKGYSINDTEI